MGVLKTAIESAKEDGKNYAMGLISKANSNSEISKAAEVALFLGAAALAVAAAKKLAQARIHRAFSSGGSSSWGGGSFRGGGSSSGTFGGFGGGHFGGGGGGAKW